eukprot:RCo016083
MEMPLPVYFFPVLVPCPLSCSLCFLLSFDPCTPVAPFFCRVAIHPWHGLRHSLHRVKRGERKGRRKVTGEIFFLGTERTLNKTRAFFHTSTTHKCTHAHRSFSAGPLTGLERQSGQALPHTGVRVFFGCYLPVQRAPTPPLATCNAHSLLCALHPAPTLLLTHAVGCRGTLYWENQTRTTSFCFCTCCVLLLLLPPSGFGMSSLFWLGTGCSGSHAHRSASLAVLHCASGTWGPQRSTSPGRGLCAPPSLSPTLFVWFYKQCADRDRASARQSALYAVPSGGRCQHRFGFCLHYLRYPPPLPATPGVHALPLCHAVWSF